MGGATDSPALLPVSDFLNNCECDAGFWEKRLTDGLAS
jgi:hypothetical protein